MTDHAGTVHTRRLGPDDRALARVTFGLMAAVFDVESRPLSDSYIDTLLARDDFFAVAALLNGEVIGGITTHALPMTTSERRAAFIYDVAVHAAHQRTGVGRRMMQTLRDALRSAGIGEVFVPADNEDTHALRFYEALGGAAQPVTIFDFDWAMPASRAERGA
ncbi:MAG: GNAT family N-acetyltransferase [Acidobacteria bacterium]|nr:GNAT family N-acetyltransferase [Acidobacteriota bacterium]